MTTICFLMSRGELSGFEISGHSGFAQEGSDIVCAAISSAAYLTANTITDVIGAKCHVHVENGRMKLFVENGGNGGDEESERQLVECRHMLKGFMLHMKQLRKQRPDNIRIITVNTGKEHYYA